MKIKIKRAVGTVIVILWVVMASGSAKDDGKVSGEACAKGLGSEGTTAIAFSKFQELEEVPGWLALDLARADAVCLWRSVAGLISQRIAREDEVEQNSIAL